MSWEKWVLVVVSILGALLTVGFVGRQRGPITPGIAVWTVILNALYVSLFVFA